MSNDATFRCQSLFDKHNNSLVKLLRYLCNPSVQMAEEVAQDVWVAVMESVANFSGEPDSEFPWLAAIARHRVTYHYRRAKRRPVLPLDEVMRRLDEVAQPPAIIFTFTPKAQAALLRLDSLERDVIEMIYRRNCSQREAAELLGTSQSDVCRTLASALLHLSDALEVK